MNQSWAIGVSVVVVYATVLLISRRFKKPSRYERSPKILNTWSALDKGIDPSEESFT